LAVPVTGTAQQNDVSGAAPQEMAGTFTIQRFARQGSGVVAIGTLVASFEEQDGSAVPETDAPETAAAGAPGPPVSAASAAAPARTIVSRLALPLVESDAGGNMQAAQVACQNLRLQLGPEDLTLLGVALEVAPVQLDVSAPQVAGTRLGNELCSAGGLVGGGQADRLVAVLNRILELLG
jgi:hypothetical protein